MALGDKVVGNLIVLIIKRFFTAGTMASTSECSSSPNHDPYSCPGGRCSSQSGNTSYHRLNDNPSMIVSDFSVNDKNFILSKLDTLAMNFCVVLHGIVFISRTKTPFFKFHYVM